MSMYQPGLLHAPVTPFTRDGAIDFVRYAKLIEFHLANRADGLALPMHAGESVSLSDGERRTLVEFAIKQVKGRKPVVAHVSETGTAVAAALARHAEEQRATAIVATTPYYWTPPAAMVLEHFVQIGSAVKIPFFLYNAPEEMQGAKVDAELCRNLVAKVPNFAGVIDLSLDWQFMIELMTDAPELRPGFQLLAGTELMVSAAAIGATGMLAPLAGITPRLVRELYDLCRAQKLFEARKVQEQIAALRQALKPGGVASLKAAMRAMGRDCGEPRPPVLALDAAAYQKLVGEIETVSERPAEPNGW
jgi:dihydrodipicolinate synthase/N-acetylneuraminate lyase